MNGYDYAGDNPVTDSDPTGLSVPGRSICIGNVNCNGAGDQPPSGWSGPGTPDWTYKGTGITTTSGGGGDGDADPVGAGVASGILHAVVDDPVNFIAGQMEQRVPDMPQWHSNVAGLFDSWYDSRTGITPGSSDAEIMNITGDATQVAAQIGLLFVPGADDADVADGSAELGDLARARNAAAAASLPGSVGEQTTGAGSEWAIELGDKGKETQDLDGDIHDGSATAGTTIADFFGPHPSLAQAMVDVGGGLPPQFTPAGAAVAAGGDPIANGVVFVAIVARLLWMAATR